LDVVMLIVHIELESGYSGNTLTLVGIILGALSTVFLPHVLFSHIQYFLEPSWI